MGGGQKEGRSLSPSPHVQAKLIAVESTLAGQEIQTPIEESFSFFVLHFFLLLYAG